MSSHELKHKPLLEAIFELRWQLKVQAPGIESDPHYRLLLGRLYDRLQDKYPEHEELETAKFPDEMVGYNPQHRFRLAPNEWPLVQLGPGIFAVNDTEKYKWEDFKPRVIEALGFFTESYPKKQDLKINKLILRYADAVKFDYESESVLGFLKDKLKITFSIPDILFAGDQIQPIPPHFRTELLFQSRIPKGDIILKIFTAKHNGDPSVIWETIFQSVDDAVPDLKDGFEDWFEKAHFLLSDWFFKMIEGDLERTFSGE